MNQKTTAANQYTKSRRLKRRRKNLGNVVNSNETGLTLLETGIKKDKEVLNHDIEERGSGVREKQAEIEIRGSGVRKKNQTEIEDTWLEVRYRRHKLRAGYRQL